MKKMQSSKLVGPVIAAAMSFYATTLLAGDLTVEGDLNVLSNSTVQGDLNVASNFTAKSLKISYPGAGVAGLDVSITNSSYTLRLFNELYTGVNEGNIELRLRNGNLGLRYGGGDNSWFDTGSSTPGIAVYAPFTAYDTVAIQNGLRLGPPSHHTQWSYTDIAHIKGNVRIDGTLTAENMLFGDGSTQTTAFVSSSYVQKSGDIMTGPLTNSYGGIYIRGGDEYDGSMKGALVLGGSGGAATANSDTYRFWVDGSDYLRAQFNATTGSLWMSFNDGSGSGLDADILDGLDSTDFVKTSGDSMTGALANDTAVVVGSDPELVTITPSGVYGGSEWGGGLSFEEGWLSLGPAGQATRLGFDGNDGFDIIAAHHLSITASSIRISAPFTSAITVKGNDDASTITLDVPSWYPQIVFKEGDNLQTTSITFGENGSPWLERDGQYTMWDAGNDGSGSGLDADVLDGLDSSEFIQSSGGTMNGDLNMADQQSLSFNGAVFIHDDGSDALLIEGGDVTIAGGLAVNGAAVLSYVPPQGDISMGEFTQGGP